MYSYTGNASAQLTVIGGLKFVFILAGSVWGISQFTGGFGFSPQVTAKGEYSPLQFPPSHNSVYYHTSSGRTLDLRSLWKFQIQNESSKSASTVRFELPFDGVYRIDRKGSDGNRLFAFQKRIDIGDLDPDEKISVMVWTDKEIKPNLESRTRIYYDGGTVSVDYPVKVTGFLAWVQTNKHVFFAGLLILTLYLLI